MQQLEHGVIAGLGAGRQRLVKAFTPYSSVFGELSHATGTRLAVIRCSTNEFDVEQRTLGVIGRLPLTAGKLKDMVGHNHRERGALLLIPLLDSLAAHLNWRIENMKNQIVPIALDTTTEVNASCLLNKTQLKYDIATAIEKTFAVVPDEFDESIFALDVPWNNVLLRAIRAENGREPFVKGDVCGPNIQGQRHRIGGFSRANRAFY